MTVARWYAQPFPPTGSISAEGIKKTLGRPPLPWPAILVREAAQNSWDARVGGQPVRFVLDLATVLPQHIGAWRTLLLEGAPRTAAFPLLGLLRGRGGVTGTIRTLTVSDRGTKGLGGPTRADVVRGDEPRDWVSFALNVGDPPDLSNGGGTYGYGKGVFYQTSGVGTVIVHTRTATPAGLQSRLIAICLGESVELPVDGAMKPFTGRYWWGDARSEHVEPLVDADAAEVAASLGLRQFRDDETGTDVTIVHPFGDEVDGRMAKYLADSIAWNLWPIMLEDRGDDRMIAEVRHAGVTMSVPAPERTPGLKTFVSAYKRLRQGTQPVSTLRCERPRKDLGRLALDRQLMPAFEPPEAAQDLGILGTPHHVCLMRTPELVVKYHAGPTPISADLAYGGVFRAFDDMDRTYADAEPPTHDEWVHAQLEGHERTYVNVTFRRLNEQLAEFVRPAPVKADGVRTPLGAVSNFLGKIISASSGTGASSIPVAPQRPQTSRSSGESIGGGLGGAHGRRESDSSWPPSNGGTGVADHGTGGVREGFGATTGSGPTRGTNGAGEVDTPRTSLRAAGEPYYAAYDDGVFLVQDAVAIGTGRIAARGTAGIVIADGSRESDPPEKADTPVVKGWRVDGHTYDGDVIRLPHVLTGQVVSLLVRPVPDTITVIGMDNLREGASRGR